MKREGVHDKACRYLAEGRVVLGLVDEHDVVACVRGDGALYEVTYKASRNTLWRCSCPARGRCAHLLAVQLVTAPGRTLR